MHYIQLPIYLNTLYIIILLMESHLSYIKQYNQEHLLMAYDKAFDKEYFSSKLKEINFSLLKHLYENKDIKQSFSKEDIKHIDTQVNPDCFSQDDKLKFTSLGAEFLCKGKGALMILAAGIGSRLGYDKPKGTYNIQMPSNNSLFEYLFNRVFSLQTLVKNIYQANGGKEQQKDIPIIVHTSEENDAETREFFRDNNYFDLNKNQVYFLPVITSIQALEYSTGKIILKSENEIFQSPNGNGGCLTSLKESGLLSVLIKNQVEVINVISIDNPLTKVLDPLFVGYHLHTKAGFSVKFIEKKHSQEAAGVFLLYKNKPYMLDYGDIPKEISEEKDENGKLKYRAANMLSYLLSLDLLNDILHDQSNLNTFSNLYHNAVKRILGYDVNEGKIKEQVIIKFELFLNTIFEFNPDNKPFILFEAKREEEFSPVKSNEGKENTPATCRKIMSNLFFSWLINSGAEIKDDHNNKIMLDELKENYLIEVDFKISYCGENLSFLKNEGVKLTTNSLLIINKN